MEFIGCYNFSKLAHYAALLVMLQYVLGRCNNVHYTDLLTVWLCGRVFWYLVDSMVRSVLPYHCLSRNCYSGFRSVYIVRHVCVVVRCLGLSVAGNLDRPFAVQE
jgi:hypothetical protein